METIKAWEELLPSLVLPRYNDLPEVPLYSDQVLEYVNKYLQPFYLYESSLLTKTMINNYVKHKVMPAPIKKRYNRSHLAYIISITILKRIMSIPNVSRGIEAALDKNDSDIEKTYDTFVFYLEDSLKEASATLFNIPIERSSMDIPTHSILLPLRSACFSFSSKLLADHSFYYLINKLGDNHE